MAQAVSGWPHIAEAQDCSRSVHVGFVADKIVLGQVLLLTFRFSPVGIIPLWISTLIYQLGG
jgi:hypothetical protein